MSKAAAVISLVVLSACGGLGVSEVPPEDCSWSAEQLEAAEPFLMGWEGAMVDAGESAWTELRSEAYDPDFRIRVNFNDEDPELRRYAGCVHLTTFGQNLNLRLVVFDDVASAEAYSSSYSHVAQHRLDARRYDLASPDDSAISDGEGFTIWRGLESQVIGGEENRALRFFDFLLATPDCPLILVDGAYTAVGEPPTDEVMFDLMNKASREIAGFVRQRSGETLCREPAEVG